MSSNIKHYDFIEIIDKRDNSIMTSGNVITMKHMPVDLISIDYKYFFTTQENPIFEIKKKTIGNIIKFNEEKYKDFIIPYVTHDDINFDTCFIFREHNITELDPEIAPLVYALNEAGYETTGSCCGHGEKEAWIRTNFKDFQSILFLFDIINNNKFKSKFELRTNPSDVHIKPGEIRLSLETLDVGEEAYKNIKDLANYIRKKINLKP